MCVRVLHAPHPVCCRHRVGDDTRALVLARWGGLGGHRYNIGVIHTRARSHTRARRYQVGFSGDVHELTWSNLAYQPYFSVSVQRQQALAPAVAL